MNIKCLIIAILLFSLFGSDCLADSNEITRVRSQKCLASKYAGYFQEITPILLPTSTPDHPYPRQKSEGTALLLAIGPGFVIHGLGHAYAGDGVTFGVLLGCEVVGGYYLIDAFKRALDENSTDELSNTETALRASAIIVLFFGSWAYDIMFAPGAVEKHNEEVRAHYGIDINENGRIGFSLSYSF
jgi:hypothetical protein